MKSTEKAFIYDDEFSGQARDKKILNIQSEIKELTSFKFWFELIFVIIPIAFLIRTFIFGLYKVPSGSMETTLLVSESFVSDKLSYWFTKPKRGDIIAFKETMHALKGAAAALGAERLRVLAHQMERMQVDVAVDHVELTKRLTGALSESIALLRERIAAARSNSLQRH